MSEPLPMETTSGRDVLLAMGLAVIFIAAHPYGFLEAEDASVYFGYYNNGSHPGFPFYYAGYIALLPEVSAFLAAYLPFPLQPPIYMITAAVFGVYLIVQMTALLRSYVRIPALAYCLAATIILLLLKTNSSFNFFTSMTYSIWFGWVGFSLRLVNMLNGRRAGPVEITASLLALLSHPYSVLGLPVLALILCLRRSIAAPIRREALLYIAMAGLFAVFCVDHSYIPASAAQMTFGQQTMLVMVRHANAYVILGGASVVVLLGVIALAIGPVLIAVRDRQLAPSADLVLIVLAYIGLASLIAYIASPRYLSYDTLGPRYIIGALVGAYLAIVIRLATRPRFAGYLAGLAEGSATPSGRRVPRFTVPAATACWIVLLVLANSVKGSATPKTGFGATIDGERFMAEAAAWRTTCQDGAMIHHWNKWALVLLCHRAELPSAVEPVGITGDRIRVYGEEGLASAANRPAEDVPRIFQPLRDIALVRH